MLDLPHKSNYHSCSIGVSWGRYLSLLLICLPLCFQVSSGQVHTADDVLVSSDGSIFVTGQGEGNTFRSHILGSNYTMKLDSDGVVQWVYDGGNSFPGHTLVQDSQGALYVISESQSSGTPDQLVKILPDGSVAWQINLGEGLDGSLSISQDGELCVSTTYRYDYSGGYRSHFNVFRVGPEGGVRWSRTVEQSVWGLQKASTIATTSGCYLGGDFKDSLSFQGETSPIVVTGGTSSSAFLAFFGLNGQVEWAKRLSSELVTPRQMIADAEHNVYLTGIFKNPMVSMYGSGNTELESAGNFDVFVAKTNSTGDLEWAKSLGGAFYDNANSMAIDAQGQLHVFGSWGLSDANGNTDSQLFFAQFDPDDNQTVFSLDGFVTESPRPDWKFTRGEGISFGPSGEKVIVGSLLGTATMGMGSGVEKSLSGEFDLFVSKYDSNDQLVWAYGSEYIEPADPNALYYPRFTSLEVGNIWEYEISDLSQTGAPGPYLLFDIPEERLANGHVQKILRAREFETNGVLRDESMCSIEVLGPGEFSAPELISCSESGSQCRCMSRMVDEVVQKRSNQIISVNEQVNIGPWGYWLDAKAQFAFVGTGTGGSGGGSNWIRGTDVGLIQYGQWSRCHQATVPQGCKDTSWRADLVFAKVDGRTFGATAVRVEENEKPNQFNNTISQPYPNPATGSISIEVTIGSPQTVAIQVYDLTGRAVTEAQDYVLPSGRSELKFKTPPIAQSGVYFMVIKGNTIDSTVKVVFMK